MKHFSWPSFKRYWKSGVVELWRNPTSKSQWERFTQFTIDMIFHGFTSADIWSVDCCIVEFALPRLKKFSNYPVGGPTENITEREWHNIINNIIKGLKLYQKDRCSGEVLSEKEKKKRDKGMQLFFKYFDHLWN